MLLISAAAGESVLGPAAEASLVDPTQSSAESGVSPRRRWQVDYSDEDDTAEQGEASAETGRLFNPYEFVEGPRIASNANLTFIVSPLCNFSLCIVKSANV